MNTIVETRVFSRKVAENWSEDEYDDFKAFITINPRAGKVDSGTGGVRKFAGKEKEAGKRVAPELSITTRQARKPGC